MSERFKSLSSTGFLALIAATSANATELCVKCTGPDASYACVIGGNSNATIDTVAKLYCITALAKSGSHASCSIDRSATPPCRGERKELPIPTFLDDSGSGEQPEDTHAPGKDKTSADSQQAKTPQPPSPATQPGSEALRPQEQPPAPTANEPPPKTVQEMVEKSAKSAGAGLNETQKSAGEAAKSASTALEKAGSAVGGAAKNSWKCLSSFFSNC